jgi:hypothetical protein
MLGDTANLNGLGGKYSNFKQSKKVPELQRLILAENKLPGFG